MESHLWCSISSSYIHQAFFFLLWKIRLLLCRVWKGALMLSLRLILLRPSFCMFTLSTGLLSAPPSFFLSGMPFKLSRPWWKWSERIAQTYCFCNRLLFSLLTDWKRAVFVFLQSHHSKNVYSSSLLWSPVLGWVLERQVRNKLLFFHFSYW